MNILDYKINNSSNGHIISKFINDYINIHKCDNILFIRTPTTGDWLDKLCKNNNNIVRILYDTKHITGINSYDRNKIEYHKLNNKLQSLNKKFDLICIDPFHEYNTSINDFNMLYLYLSNNGTIISHDCYPKTKNLATPIYKKGEWCGETYIAFVEFAYNNPTLFYGLLNIDTGIGIISRKNINYLTNILNIQKQEIFLSMHKNNNPNVYEYFCENSVELSNAITLY